MNPRQYLRMLERKAERKEKSFSEWTPYSNTP